MQQGPFDAWYHLVVRAFNEFGYAAYLTGSLLEMVCKNAHFLSN